MASDDLIKTIRRMVLRPLLRRPPITSPDQLNLAARRLDQRAANVVLARHMAEVSGKEAAKLSDEDDPESIKEWVSLARSLHKSGKISRDEYVFYVAFRAEQLAESRIREGHYDDLLDPIYARLDEIEEELGIDPDEARPEDLPIEYQQLNREFSELHDSFHAEAFREIGLDDLLKLKETNPDAYRTHRERGRRVVFHADETVPALKDVVVRYEKDARTAAEAEAFTAAVTTIGAALEGLLLVRTLQSPHKARRVAAKLPRRVRPNSTEDITRWRFETLVEVCLEAGWLPPVETQVATWNSAALAHQIRQLRNLVHPGKLARERPWARIGEREYEDAFAVYRVLLAIVKRRLPKRSETDASS